MESNRGAIFALSAIGLSATMGVGFKLSVSRLDSLVVAIYIGLFATVAMFLNLYWRGKLSEILSEFRRQPLFFIFAGMLGLGIEQLFYMQAYQSMPAARVVFLFYSYPLLMGGFSWLIFKEKITLRATLILLIGFVGIGFLLLSNGGISSHWGTGVWITLLASAIWAFFCVIIKHRKFDAEVGMFLFNLFGTIFLLACMPWRSASYAINFREFVGLGYLAIFPTAAALICWNKALHMLKTSICSNLALLTPMLSVILIILILKESLSGFQIAGFAMIIGSVFLNLNLPDARTN